MPPPAIPKIYHIVHLDRLPSIIADGGLLSDAMMKDRAGTGTTIGMGHIKDRRLNELTLASHPDLYVGKCVPFYFCPRSIMLYVIHRGNRDELTYDGGQEPIIHLEADLHTTVTWAETHGRRWAFTLSNAGAYYFEDRSDLGQIGELNWTAIEARDWRNCKDEKQAEFLVEKSFPWELTTRIGVKSHQVYRSVRSTLQSSGHKPHLEICPQWYYG